MLTPSLWDSSFLYDNAPVISCVCCRLTTIYSVIGGSKFWYVVWESGKDYWEVSKSLRWCNSDRLLLAEHRVCINKQVHTPVSVSPCCHAVKCPWEILSTSLSDSVVPDIAPLLTQPDGFSCHILSVVPLYSFQPGESEKQGRQSMKRKHYVQIFQNVEGECCHCFAMGKKNLYFVPLLMTPCAHSNHLTHSCEL